MPMNFLMTEMAICVQNKWPDLPPDRFVVTSNWRTANICSTTYMARVLESVKGYMLVKTYLRKVIHYSYIVADLMSWAWLNNKTHL